MRIVTVILLALACGACTPPPPPKPPDARSERPAPSPAANATTSTRIPDRHLGRYAANADACARDGDVSRLELAADRVTFHESAGSIVAAQADDDVLRFTARITGEGETREAGYSYRVGDDGSLTDLDAGIVRVRCD